MHSEFSKNLKDILQRRNITLKDLAKRANTTEVTLSRYCNGLHKPSLEVVVNVANSLDTSIDYLLGITPIQRPYKTCDRYYYILQATYQRSDEHHRKIIWTVLEEYLTPDEKKYIETLGKNHGENKFSVIAELNK